MDGFIRMIKEELGSREKKAQDIQPLALAYLGDTLCDLYVRSLLTVGSSLSPHQMHLKASSYVNAASQAKMAELLMDDLTQEEQQVLRHARNQKSLTVPKNMSPVDYKWATGFEALLGYLFIDGQEERCWQIMKTGLSKLEAEKEKRAEEKQHE